jgi:hypothetical protein
MLEQFRRLTEDSSLSYSSMIYDSCKQLVPTVSNKTVALNDKSSLTNYFRQYFAKENITFNSLSECISALKLVINEDEDELNPPRPRVPLPHVISRSLIIFVILIGFVSLISIIGNLCLAKVLYSKRYRLIQTDRIVLCLALSKRKKFGKRN